MSAAYESVLRLSFEVRAGLLMRQIHHWAALIFVAPIVVHAMRVFFTGAFRKPREINWLVGVSLLIFAIGMGFTGYSLPDDLLSGTGLRIAYSVMLSIPFIGPYITFLVFGGVPNRGHHLSPLRDARDASACPGHRAHHRSPGHPLETEARAVPGPGRTEGNVVGKAFWPSQVFKSTGLMLLVAAVLAALGGLVQINGVWAYGPFDPTAVSGPAQPDWYVGWLEGGLRLFPAWEWTLFGVTIPSAFVPGVVIPGLVFTILALWPFIEQRITKDYEVHNLLDRPRDVPWRTAVGTAGFLYMGLLTIAGGNDVLALTFNIPVEGITWFLRVALLVVPVVGGMIAYRVCKELQVGGDHPLRRRRGTVLRRTTSGGFEEVH